MMPRLCSLLNDAGVDARWLVLTPEDPRFFKATKAVHNMLHGQPAALEPSDFDGIYDDVSRAAADELRCIVNRSDVLIVHDPQPAGVARYLPAAHRPRLLWRCHIGVPYRNAQTAMAWRIFGMPRLAE